MEEGENIKSENAKKKKRSSNKKLSTETQNDRGLDETNNLELKNISSEESEA